MNPLPEFKNGASCPGVCGGSRHIKRRHVGPDDPRFVELHSQLDYCKDSWRSKHCQHVVDAERLDCKHRCLRCKSLDKNIRAGQYPQLYNAVEKTTDRSISQAIIECNDKFREHILFRLASLKMELMLPKILNSPWPPPSCVLLVVSYLICTTSVLLFVAVVATVLTSRIHGPMFVPSAIRVNTMWVMPNVAPNAKKSTRRSAWMHRAGHPSVRLPTTSGSNVSRYSTRDERSRVGNCSVLLTRSTRRKMRSG